MVCLMDKEVCGFSLKLADRARKAVAKKSAEALAETEKNLYEYGEKCGRSKKFLDYLWNVQIEMSKSYAFAACHSREYGTECLQELNLYYYYPKAYWNTAVITTQSQSDDERENASAAIDYGKIAQSIYKAWNNGIKVSSPDINEAKQSMTDSHVSRAYDFKNLRDQLYTLIHSEVNTSADGLQQEQDARTRQDNYILGIVERKDNEHKLAQTTEASARTAADTQLSNAIEAHKEEAAKKFDDMKSYTDTRYDELANTITQLRNDMKEEAAKAAAANSMPVGCVIAWPLNADIPDGYLECNGQVVNATSYPLLAALMGSTPDMRTVFLQGSSTAGQLVQAGLPNLTGYVYAFTGHKAGEQETDGNLFTVGNTTHSSQTTPGADDGYVKEVRFDASKGNTIYGQSETVQPPAYTVKWIIKAR